MKRLLSSDSTNPSYDAHAYRAAGRPREAQTLERMASALGDSAPDISPQLLEAFRKLHSPGTGLRFKDLGRGMFQCPRCGRKVKGVWE